MDAGFLHGAWTAALLAVFAAIVVWAWSGRRKRDFEEAARLPLEEDAENVDRERGRRQPQEYGTAAHPRPDEDPTRTREQGARHG